MNTPIFHFYRNSKKIFCTRSFLNLTCKFFKKNLSTSQNSKIPQVVDLSYTVFKPDGTPSSAVPVIILHGMLGSKQNWRGLAKAISKNTRRTVYALDARNHGDSPHTAGFSYVLMTEDVTHFMHSHSMESATIIGHSMGGRTAMYLALSQTNLVNKLVVVDVSPKNMPRQSLLIPGYMREMRDALQFTSGLSLVQARATVDDYLAKSIPEEQIRQFLLTNLTEKNGTVSWKPNLDVLLEKFEEGVSQFPPTSGHCFADTLFICGGDSPFVKQEDHLLIKTLFPKADIVSIPGAGHWVHSEKPSEFLEYVYGFL